MKLKSPKIILRKPIKTDHLPIREGVFTRYFVFNTPLLLAHPKLKEVYKRGALSEFVNIYAYLDDMPMKYFKYNKL